MKTSKRILATLVAVMLAVTSLTLPTFAAFTDLTEEAQSYTAVNVLNMLGVINGYDDGSFKPENNVTRAEFTAMLLRTRGMGKVGSTSLENPPFPDVTTSDVSWAIGNIRTARELGIINGYDDGTFKPNNNVSYEEAVKMIVCALGYGEMGTEGAYWYSRYLMSATSLGFLDGAGGVIGSPATREVIANMLYNCLEVKLAENNEITDKTILENDLKLTKNVGYIASNPTISLFAPESNLRDNEVQIKINGEDDPVTYQVDDASKYNDMLGAQITYYYTENRESGFKTIISATVDDTETLEIEANLISDNTDAGIEYYRNEDSERSNTAGIAEDSVVVYNGKLFGADEESSTFKIYVSDCDERGVDAMPTIGKVKLLDRNGDNKYDVVFIDSYEAWIASSVTSSNWTITDNVLRANAKAEDKKLVLEKSSNVKILDASGNEIGFTGIKKDNVLAVKKDSWGGKTAIVTNKTVSGKVSAVNSKKGITINGNTYKFSKQAPWERNAAEEGALEAPKYGDSGKFYLDIDGKTAIVTNKTVSGKVSAVSSKKGITINGNTYKFSKQAPWERNAAEEGALEAPKYGDSGKFYLDIDGNIIAYDKTEAVTVQYYGYVISATVRTEDGFDETLRVTISTKSKPAGERYYITTKTKINADSYSDLNDALDALGGNISQGVKFTLGKNNEIDEIVTAEPVDGGSDIKADSLYVYYEEDVVEKDTKWKYNSSTRELYLGERSNPTHKIYIGNAVMLSVKGSTTKYKAMTTNDFANTDIPTYEVEAFDMTSTGSAKFMVVYDGAGAVGKVKATSPVMVITESRRDTVGDEVRTVLSGYVGNSFKSDWALSVLDDDTVSTAGDLQEGDVVRLGTDSEGYYTVKPEHIIFSTTTDYRDDFAINQPIILPNGDGNTEESDSYPKAEKNDNGSIVYQVVWGSAYQYDGDSGTRFILSADILDADETTSNTIALEKSAFSNARIFEYDSEEDEFNIVEDDYLNVLGGLVYSGSGSVPSELFVYMTSENTVATMIIVR